MSNARREFEMTQEQLDKMLEACKRNLKFEDFGGAMVAHVGPDYNAVNEAWKKLGDEMGFFWKTVLPVPEKGDRFFTAVPGTNAAKEAPAKPTGPTPKHEPEVLERKDKT